MSLATVDQQRPSARLGVEFDSETGRGLWVSPRHIALLQEIQRQGSISAASRSLGLSFRGAWLMLDNMERCIGCELLVRSVGGRGGGGASISREGVELIELMHQLSAGFREGLLRLREAR